LKPPQLTVEEWRTLIDAFDVAIVAIITAICTGIAGIITTVHTGKKIEKHDERSAARARESGQSDNPVILPEDKGHV
jgi:hypothetical protein